MQQLRQTESTLHRRQAEHTAVLVAKDTAQQQAEQAETKVECLHFYSVSCSYLFISLYFQFLLLF